MSLLVFRPFATLATYLRRGRKLRQVFQEDPMKLTFYASFLAKGRVIDLPTGATATLHATDDYASIAFHNVTPAQLHDAIGCMKADAIVAMCGALVRARAELRNHRCDDRGYPNSNVEDATEEVDKALTAIEAARHGRQPCADCDSGAEDIPPHDCPNVAKQAVR